MSNVHAFTGVLADKRTVILDKESPFPPGRVRVTVEPLPKAHSDGTFLAKLHTIRQALYASGYRPREKKEIDAQIQAERESWEL